jgi:hypothetical protein
MELNLQPLAATCFVSGQPFAPGDRVASYLVRPREFEIVRYDLRADQAAAFTPDGAVACRWTHLYKPKARDGNPERTLKLTAETLFLTLADPGAELAPENARLVQFLALMLERKKVLRPKGKAPDGERDLFEHARSHQLYAVPAGEMTPEFFTSLQGQLGLLVGEPRARAPAAAAPA